jgi:hypothetical protein
VDSILKSFEISFLLRSMFAGAFFVISYYVASHTPQELAKIDDAVVLSVALPVSVFAGVTAYGIHRSLFFPLIEYCFDSACATRLRKWLPLISSSTMELILRRWDRAAEDKNKWECERAKRLTVWADYTQLQYTSTLCIGLGALVGKTIVPGQHAPFWPLIGLAIFLFVAAIVSDWRLHSMDERSHSK